MSLLTGFFLEFVYFFNEIAIYLLFGFVVAGILHVLFPDSFIKKHLGQTTVGSVFKSTLFGIPLPICSCGVIPVATSLRRSGASRGATISFLIATPQIGADSFMITYSLLGWVFGVFRILAAAVTSLISGILVNLYPNRGQGDFFVTLTPVKQQEQWPARLRNLPAYVEYTLLGAIADRLIIGIVLAGLIAIAIPDQFFSTYLSSDFLSMLLMMVIGIPMYVCASASTPIAASLIMKGLSPGAALIFLLTGPATNIISISAVHKIIGRTPTLIYLGVIAAGSLGLGYILNLLTQVFGLATIIQLEGTRMLPAWLKAAGSVILLAMLAWYYIKTKIVDRKKEDVMSAETIILSVEGMTCHHCTATVQKALAALDGISEVTVDLDAKEARFLAKDDQTIQAAIAAVKDAGYEARLK